MKLEAVNPLSPENIHVATVTRVKGQYIWLSLEGNMGFSTNVFLFNMKINMDNICINLCGLDLNSLAPVAQKLLYCSLV